MTFGSTFVTIFGICKIFRTSSELKKYNSNVTLNKRNMILHSILLTLQSLVTVLNTTEAFIPIFFNHGVLINIVMNVVDLIVQLMICYICLTMGSSV